MNCAEINPLIEALFDEAVDSKLKGIIEEHIAVCATCCETWKRLRCLSDMLHQGTEPIASVALDARVMRSFYERRNLRKAPQPLQQQRGFVGSIRILRLAFASAVAVILLGLPLAFKLGRMSATPVVIAPQADSLTSASTPKIVEIPVVKTEVVTRVVYVEKKRAKDRDGRNQTSSDRNAIVAESRSQGGGAYYIHSNLSGFQPVQKMKLKVVKKEGDE